jgi:ribosomal protein L24
MNLKKGDNVMIISGKDKGKSGTIRGDSAGKGPRPCEGLEYRKKAHPPHEAGREGPDASR